MHSTLDPSLNVYVEYSNELWNGGFAQYTRNIAAAKANPQLTATDDFGRAGEEAAFRTMQIATIFRTEFGAQSSQVKPVLGGQIANTYFSDRGLAWIQSHYGAPSQYLAGVAIAPYLYLDTSIDTPGLTMDALFANLNSFLNTTMASWIATRQGLRQLLRPAPRVVRGWAAHPAGERADGRHRQPGLEDRRPE